MTSELVVDVQPKEISIALLEDKSLVELQSEEVLTLSPLEIFTLVASKIDARIECLFR